MLDIMLTGMKHYDYTFRFVHMMLGYELNREGDNKFMTQLIDSHDYLDAHH